jgi:hypothetical protein
MKSQKEGGFGPPRAVTPWKKKKKKTNYSAQSVFTVPKDSQNKLESKKYGVRFMWLLKGGRDNTL